MFHVCVSGGVRLWASVAVWEGHRGTQELGPARSQDGGPRTGRSSCCVGHWWGGHWCRVTGGGSLVEGHWWGVASHMEPPF